MKFKLLALLCVAALVLSMAGCSQEEKTTTLSGVVVSIEGTVVNLWQIDANNLTVNPGNGQGQRPSGGQQWQRPEGNFTMPEEGFTRPEGSFTRPEGGSARPEGNMPRPEGDFTMPEEGFTRPNSNTDRPQGSQRPDFGNSGNGDKSYRETTAVDLKNAHIAILDGDIKASGSLDDIKVGSYLTITLNSKQEATEVLVSSADSFGGNRFWGNGFGGNKSNRKDRNQNNTADQTN